MIGSTLPAPQAAAVNFITHITTKDQFLADRFLSAILSIYGKEGAKLLIISDGAEVNGLLRAKWRNNLAVNLIENQRPMKTKEYGGLWLERLLRYSVLCFETDYVIKVDPDTQLNFALDLSLINAIKDILGTCVTVPLLNEEILIARGGGRIIRREAAMKILASNYLRDPLYHNSEFCYRNNNELLVSEDFILGHIAKRLDLKIGDWPQVKINFHEEVSAADQKTYGLTHPHKI